MNTLADEFLADISDVAKTDTKPEEQPIQAVPVEQNMDIDVVLVPKRVTDVANLLSSPKLESIIQQIEKHIGVEKAQFLGDDDPEYELIVAANEMSARIFDEILVIHKFIRDLYSKKFPELEQLVQHPLDFARVVLRLRNNTSSTNVESLSDILPTSNVITISMAASNTTGAPLEQDEIERITEACETALKIDECRQKILMYVEGRMQIFAPNISAIVGTEIATKLIGAAGGLHQLASMPSSNLFVVGKKKKALEGFSSATALKHQGFIADCDIIKKTPKEDERRACRLVANKCSLAARADFSRDHYRNGELGQRLREEIEKKIEKWQEPPPKKKEKALPAPLDIPRKRRGGAKQRKYKERYAMTEVRKRQMRLPFGAPTEEYQISGSIKSLGMLTAEGSGIIRANVKEEKGFKSKKRKLNEKQQKNTPGFATSVYALTPHLGLKLETPESALEKSDAENEGYFSSAVGFMHVNKKQKT